VRPFGFGKSPKRIQGSIGYFGLEDWWLTAFSDDERRHIQETFQPFGSSGDSLTPGAISYTSQTAVGLLGALAGWFGKPEDRPIAHKILDKAAELSKDAPVLDVHFLYQQMIEAYYKDRDKPEYMGRAVEACRRQIALAPDAAKAFKAEYSNSPLPAHKGYEQLAIIMEKEGHFQDAISLSHQAESEGWAGDWGRRVERCEKKLRRA
jgi:hypothetical protein